MEKKICSRCNIEKDLYNFGILKSSKDGYRNICKECRKTEKDKNKEYYLNKTKEWRLNNQDKVKEYSKKYYIENTDRLKHLWKEYRKKNKSLMTIKKKEYIKGYFMQATAYAIMFEELTGISIPNIIIIITVDHEGVQVFEERRDNYANELIKVVKNYKKYIQEKNINV